MVNSFVGPQPRIVVLIPTLNEAAYIADVLDSLCDTGDSKYRYSVVVADGGSTDGTQDIVQQLAQSDHQLELIHNPGRTQAAAMNMMLDYGLGSDDILIRADAHAAYPAGFVDDLVDSLSAHDAASVVIPMDAVANEGCFQRGNAWIADTPLGAGGSPHRGGQTSGYVDHGHHAAFKMDSFTQIGGYDTSFVANEDAEYDQRLLRAGNKIWLDSDIRISYFPRAAPSGLWKQYYRYGRGRAQTCLKHGVVPKARQLVPVLHVMLLLLGILALPFTSIGLVWAVLYCAIVIIAGLAMVAKHRSICGLAGSLALAIMHLAWGIGFLTTWLRARQTSLSSRAVAQ